MKILNKLKSILKLNKKPILPYLETHLTDHCNLNCRACNHFCPISEEIYWDVNQFETNLKILESKFSIQKLRLLGGEPLLHPEIIKFITISRTTLPNTDIRIVSNGALIKSMKSDFWEACKKYNITIDISKYPPLNENFDNITKCVTDNHCKVGFINPISKFWISLNQDGSSNAKETFENCTAFRDCVTLYKNKIYKCPIGAYIYKYNKYYNEQIAEENGIDIENHSAEEILNYLNTPMPTCSFCEMPSEKWQLCDWAVSKKEKEEWFVQK